MSNRILWSVMLAIVGTAVVLLLPSRDERKAVVSEFEWKVDGATSPYSFQIANRTDESLHVLVTIVAETMTQGLTGVNFHPMGRHMDEIHLAPRENRRVNGVVQLIRFGTSETILTLSAELKESP